MTSTSIYKPTWLYIKQHKLTGLLYFGKTICRDPIKYKGSGTYWKLHINKHGKEYVETLWYCLFTEKEILTEFALSFSKIHNIVENEDWANLRLENGLDGGDPGIDAINNIKKALTGSKRNQSSIEKQKQTLLESPVIFTQERRNNISKALCGQVWSDDRKEHASELHKTNENCIKSRKKNFDRTGKIPWNKGLKTGPKNKL